MPAYVIADVEIHDVDTYRREYSAGVPATIAAHGGRFLVRGGAVERLEGDWNPGRFVVIEFPDADAARGWYESEEYRRLREVRWRNADSRILLVDGV
jgi:uncharacterized protein (DUF1330 family)